MLGDVSLVSYVQIPKHNVHRVEFTLAVLQVNSVFSANERSASTEKIQIGESILISFTCSQLSSK